MLIRGDGIEQVALVAFEDAQAVGLLPPGSIEANGVRDTTKWGTTWT